jgi:hypothetical protein
MTMWDADSPRERGATRIARWIGVAAAGGAAVASILAAAESLTGTGPTEAVRGMCIVTWWVAFAAAVAVWFTQLGSGVRFSLRNPPRQPAHPPRFVVRFEETEAFHGEGRIEFDGERLRASGPWRHSGWWIAAGLFMLVAVAVGAVFATLTWIHFVVPFGIMMQLATFARVLEVARGDVVEAAFLRDGVILALRGRDPIRFTMRPSRVAELATRLSDAGVPVTTVERVATTSDSAPADQDEALGRLKATRAQTAAAR